MEWVCSRCGERHEGLPDLAYDAPDYWAQLTEEERAQSVLEEDLCRVRSVEGSFFYVRGVLELPILEADELFAFGVWGSLSERSFERFVQLFDDPRRVDEPPYFSWLSNSLGGYPDTLNLRASLQVRALDLRPAVVLEPAPHPLSVDQREGITLERARALVEPALHPSG